MKLNFRLDLNTIVLLLLIVVFSVIIYYSIKKYSIFEGIEGEGVSTLQEANENLTKAQTTLDGYIIDKTKFDEAFSKVEGQATIVNNETGYIRDTLTQISTTSITPNLHVMGSQLNLSQGVLDGYNNTVNDIKTRLNLTGTINSAVSDAIQAMILAQTGLRDAAKTALDNLIKFTIKEPITAADRSVVITIENSSVVPPTYTITSNPAIPDLQYTFDANPPPGTAIATVTGLTNNTSYTFKIVAVYSSDIKYEVTSTKPVVPMGKPSVTIVGFTGYADITIVPPSDGLEPVDYTVSSDPAVPGLPVTLKSLTKRIDGLVNNTTYTISVVANYTGGTSLPATATVIPRPTPTGTVERGNKSAVVKVTPPPGDVAPVSYLVSGYKSLQPTYTLPFQQFPASNTTASFLGLENGIEYTFNTIAIYSDYSRSSPSPSLKVTPYDAPKPSVSVTATDGGAKLTITKPITTETITAYEVRAYKKDNYVEVWSSKTSNALTYDVRALSNNITYTISVVAKYNLYNSDKVEIDVIPKREPFTSSSVEVVRTAVNLAFSIKEPGPSMSSFSIKILNGGNKGKTRKSWSITDSLSFGDHTPDTEYAFDITLTYTDGTTAVLSNKKYKTLAAPIITADRTKNDIRIYVANPDLDTMQSFSIKQQNGSRKNDEKKTTNMSDKLSLGGQYRSNVEYEFDVFINYKDGQIYKKNNVKFRTLK